MSRADLAPSTFAAKMRRHRNKKRIWRRAVKRLEMMVRYEAARTVDIRAADALA